MALASRWGFLMQTTTIIRAAMKRKQLSFSEEELNILVDALHNQWWIRYDPEVETTVAPHHNLFERIINAASSLSDTKENAS